MTFSFLTGKNKKPAAQAHEGTPAIRCSICTGEQVACMRERESGRLHELMLIRDDGDLDRFCARYGLEPESLRKVY